jgi:hypothetical protein
LARTTILSSSNGGSVVTFGAGTKDVFISLPASKTNVEDQPNLIEVNSSSAALRITQTGAGNALVVEDSANPDASPFVVDASGNVGIGTSSPSEKLSVHSAIGIRGSNFASLSYFGSSVNTTGVYTGLDSAGGYVVNVRDAGYQAFLTNNTERMRIDGSGNVGIGTSSPTGKLHAVLSTSYSPGSGWSSSTAVFGGSTSVSGAFGIAYDDTNGAGLASIIPGTSYKPIYTNCSEFIVKTNGTTERMRINSSGNVGIGTASPDALLTVNTVASFGAGTVGAPSIAAKGDLNTGIYFSAADTLDFSTAGTQRGQFDSSGNFKFNSGYGSVATAYGCRAWVNFDGTGTPSIRASGNVTSITDGGTGLYTVNFTNAMPDSNFAGVLTTNNNLNDGSKADAIVLPSSASSVSINLQRKINDSASSGQQYDADFISVVIFR